MDIRRLEYFIAVCEQMNMTRAAKALHIAQPSLSNSIRQLEDELGFDLFDRSRRQLRLTDKGEILYRKAKGLVLQFENVKREMADLSTSHVGTIRLGVPPMIGTILFPRILTRYKAEHPAVDLLLSEEGSLEVKRKIIDGEVDLGIIILSEEDKRLRTHEILKTEIVACLSKTHPLNACEVITAKEIENEQVIMLKKGFYHREVLKAYFEESGIRPRTAVSTNQLKTLESLVVQGVGISFLFKELAVGTEGMTFRPLGKEMPIRICLAWRTDQYLTKASRSLIDFLEKTYS